MILYCRNCGHVWEYGGAAKKETSCPNCKAYVNLERQLDTLLPDDGDYGGAEYLGITLEDDAIYWDTHYGLAVQLIAPKYDRIEEDRGSKGRTSLEYVVIVSEVTGWKYLRPIHEISRIKNKGGVK